MTSQDLSTRSSYGNPSSPNTPPQQSPQRGHSFSGTRQLPTVSRHLLLKCSLSSGWALVGCRSRAAVSQFSVQLPVHLGRCRSEAQKQFFQTYSIRLTLAAAAGVGLIMLQSLWEMGVQLAACGPCLRKLLPLAGDDKGPLYMGSK